MKKNQVFKEIEARIIEVAGRPYISLDDEDKIISDIIFAKSDADSHTLRTIKCLNASIALTYKALKENEQLDINGDLAIIPLSKKKVKGIVEKSLKISKKDKVLEGDFDELEPYLAPEEPSLCISKEEVEELIQENIQQALEPYLSLLEDLKNMIVKAQPKQAPAVTTKKTKKKETKPKDVIEEIAAEESQQIDEQTLEELANENNE